MDVENISMKHFFNNLKKTNYFDTPVKHIYKTAIYELKKYDQLYETQNYDNSVQWATFKEELKLSYKFLNDLNDISTNVDVICLWFFKERSDRDKGTKDIEIGDKIITYFPNSLLITEAKIIIKKRKKYITRRPCLQIELPLNKYNDIISNLK